MNTRSILAALLAATALLGCGSDGDEVTNTSTPTASAQATGSQTIDQVAAASGFNALVAAVGKAGLGAALSDPSARLTVFAPSDAAFNQMASSLGFASATAMVNALPAEALASVLTYHVLPATKQAATLTATATSSEPTLYQFNGQAANLRLNVSGGALSITDATLARANVTATNVAASNGVIHVVDRVLIPPGVLTVVQMARLNPELSSLASALDQRNLSGTLSGAGPYTVFAPTNAALAAAPAGLTPEQLSTVLTYHVVGQSVLASQIPFGTAIPTLASQTIVINAETPPTITDSTGQKSNIVATDVRASNGVVHVIDRVLIPAL